MDNIKILRLYFAARKMPHDDRGWTSLRNGKECDITLVFSTILHRSEGIYQHTRHPDDYYYIHQIEWYEFDMLIAFDVPSQVGFNSGNQMAHKL